MNEAQWREIDESMVACVEALFAAVGVSLDGPHPAELDGHQVVAIIGLGGRQLRGTLLLALPTGVLSRSYPATTALPDVESLRDWAGELANQLAGRLKNQLLRRGVQIDVSLPTAVSGVDLETGSTREPSARAAHRFVAGAGACKVRLELIAEPGVALRDDETPMMVETELALFLTLLQ